MKAKFIQFVLFIINLFEDRTRNPLPKTNRSTRRVGNSVARRRKNISEGRQYPY